jgi:hypothetical protein
VKYDILKNKEKKNSLRKVKRKYENNDGGKYKLKRKLEKFKQNGIKRTVRLSR